jgi:hypothetical protein
VVNHVRREIGFSKWTLLHRISHYSNMKIFRVSKYQGMDFKYILVNFKCIHVTLHVQNFFTFQ